MSNDTARNSTISHGTSIPPFGNPDVQGYAIRLSSFIAHVCVAVLISCSPKIRQRFYLPLLSQLLPIIFAIWLCRNREQISLSDIDFAILQTRSPVSIYVLILVIPRLFYRRSVFKGTDSKASSEEPVSILRILDAGKLDWSLIQHRAWGILYVICCIGVNFTRQLSASGYISIAEGSIDAPTEQLDYNSQNDARVWLALIVCSILIYECVLHRHAKQRHEIMHQLAGTRKKPFKSWPMIKRLRWGFAATWFIATRLHPWLPFLYVTIMFLNWSTEIKIWTVEEDFEWTYGQLLAISQLPIILYPCIGLFYSRRKEIARLPRRIVLDIVWLASESGRPWIDSDNSDLILKNIWDSFPRDVTSKEKGLPTTSNESERHQTNTTLAQTAHASSISNDRTPRKRQSRTRRNRHRKRAVTEHLEEEDIADQTLASGHWNNVLADPL